MLNQKAALSLREAMLHMACSVRGILMVAAMSSALVACGGDSTTSDSSQVASSQTQSPTVVSDNTPVVANNSSAPTLRFVSPANNQGFTVVDNFSVEVVAQDDGSIQNIALFVDGQLIRYESFAPYIWGSANEVAYARQEDSAAFNSQLSGGDHQLTAVAVDDQGLSSQVSIMVSVSEPVASTPSTPPSTSGGNVTTAPDSLFASRTFGVAPLSVHFDSGYEGEDFHNYHFTWDFGDSGAGVNVHNGLNKNIDTGPIAGHLYENPGSYNASLTIRDASGIVNTQNIEIVVSDPNIVYAGSATKCISKSGSFAGCPSGAQQIIYSDAQLDSNMYTLLGVDNSRILFNRGDEWNLQGVGTGQVNDIYMGAYGSCSSPDVRGICGNSPKLVSAGTSAPGTFWFSQGSENIVIEGIHFSALSRSNTNSINLWGVENLTVNRVKGTVQTVFVAEGMNNSAIHNSDLSGGVVTMYVDGQNMIMKNTTFHDSISSHIVRIPVARKFVFTHNEVHSSTIGTAAGTGAGHLIKLHSLHEGDLCNIPNDNRTDWCRRFVQGKNGRPPEPIYSTEYVYMANNLFGRGGNWPVALMAQNGNYNEVLRDVIFEKNRFDPTYGEATSSGTFSIQLAIQSVGASVRNNLFDTEGMVNGTYSFPIVVFNRNPFTPSSGVKIINNTISTENQNFNPFVGIQVRSSAVNTEIYNNLIVRPGSTANAVAIEDEGTNTVQSNNLFVDTSPFVDSSAAPRNKNYMLNPGSSALSAGNSNAPVLDDFDGVFRSDNVDVGAYEQ